MNSQMNAREKRWCTPQLRSVFDVLSTQLSIGDMEQLRNQVVRPVTSANLALSSKSIFDELVKSGGIDETNQAPLAEYCRSVGRYDLLTNIGGRRAVPVVDPVEEFIKDRQIAENKHAKKYTLKKQDELTGHEHCQETEYSGPLTRSRKRFYEQQVPKTNDESDSIAVDGVADSATKQIRLDRTSDAAADTADQRAAASTSDLLSCPKSHIACGALRSGTSTNTTGLASAVGLPNVASAATGSTRRTSSSLSGVSMASSSNSSRLPVNTPSSSGNSGANTSASTLIRKKETCDVNLRVRAEYQDHETALAAIVGSARETETERQFERFAQANQVLRSRDLGAIVCEIKFSELTYLDAFWRDYINGSLLHALRDVFITESLRQAVNYEQVRLLITVDEDDYEMGRTRLVHNL